MLLHLVEDMGRDYGGVARRDPDAKTGVGPEIGPIAQYITDSHYAPSAALSGGNPTLVQIAGDKAKAHVLEVQLIDKFYCVCLLGNDL